MDDIIELFPGFESCLGDSSNSGCFTGLYGWPAHLLPLQGKGSSFPAAEQSASGTPANGVILVNPGNQQIKMTVSAAS